MKKRRWIFLLFLLAASFLLSCLCGRYTLGPGDLFEILSGRAAGTMKANIFWNIRVARTCVAAICGAALALSGFVYQGLFNNPLVSPDVLGVSGGASVGAISAILFFGGSAAALQIFSFLGGMATVLLALLLARAIGGGRTFSLVIAGIVLSALMNAAVMAMKYIADPTQQLAVIDYWLMGSYSLCGWEEFFTTAPLCVGSFLVLALLRYRLKVLTLGDQEAMSLGVAVAPVRAVCIAAATVLVAACVSVSGIVSWVGLIVPHLVRAILGERFEANFFQSAVCGASLLMLADTLARSLLPSEIPISILTSLMGAVCLGVFLLLRRRKGRGRDA